MTVITDNQGGGPPDDKANHSNLKEETPTTNESPITKEQIFDFFSSNPNEVKDLLKHKDIKAKLMPDEGRMAKAIREKIEQEMNIQKAQEEAIKKGDFDKVKNELETERNKLKTTLEENEKNLQTLLEEIENENNKFLEELKNDEKNKNLYNFLEKQIEGKNAQEKRKLINDIKPLLNKKEVGGIPPLNSKQAFLTKKTNKEPAKPFYNII